MSAATLTALPTPTTSAQRAAAAYTRGRQEALTAAEEAFVAAEDAALRLQELSKLELAPVGVRDGARRLASEINTAVVRMAALAARAREA